MSETKAPTRRKEARQPGAGPPPMRRYTLASLGLHLVFLAFLSFPIVQQQRPVLADPIYEVALIDAPEPNYLPPKPARAPKPKPVEKPKPKPEPKKDEVVVPKRDQPKPKPVEKPKTPEEKPVEAEKPVDLPNVPEEPVSMGIVDQRDFKHDYYLELLRGILARAWDPPTGGQGLQQVSVHFVIRRDGTIETPEITVPSGWALLDRSALGAVLGVKKLPPLPEAYSGDQLGLTVNFQRMGDNP